MNIYKLSGKTWKDQYKHDNKTLYHISSKRLTNLFPKSKFWGHIGLFMSVSYKSIISDWSGFVKNKKTEKHPLIIDFNKVNKELFKLEDEIQKIDSESDNFVELNLKLEELNNRRDEISESLRKDSFTDNNKAYKEIYIHKISCPKIIYEKAVKLYNDAYNNRYMDGEIGFWAWGSQVFIIEEWLPQLKIISIEKLDSGSLMQKYKEINRRPYDINSMSDPEWNPKVKRE